MPNNIQIADTLHCLSTILDNVDEKLEELLSRIDKEEGNGN